MLAKISKSYQFEDEKDYEKFVSGSFEAIMKHARILCGPDTEEEQTISHDQGGETINLVHWVNEYDAEFEETGEPNHYWKFVVTVKFVADVVEECKDEVVTI